MKFRRPFAAALAALVAVLSPGFSGYEAAAQIVSVEGAAHANAGGAAAAVSGVLPISAGASMAAPLSPSGSYLSGAGLSAPSPVLSAAMPSPAASVHAAPASARAAAVPALSAASTPERVAPASAAEAAAAPAPGAAPIAAEPAAPVRRNALQGVPAAAEAAAVAPGSLDENGLRALYDRQKAASGQASAVAGQPGEAVLGSGLAPAHSVPAAASTAETPAPAAPAAKPSFWSHFSLSDFNSSQRAYILGQAVFLFAISIYLASLPLLVKSLTGDAALTGVVRMVHYWVFAGASLVSGAVVARTPMKRILVFASATRGVLFGAIGLATLAGFLPWTAFLVMVGLNGAVVSITHLVDIDSGGAQKIFESDEKINKANYVYDFLYNGMMLIGPALVGMPMDFLDHRFGAGVGAAVGYALFGVLMLAVSAIYALKVKVIGEAESAWKFRMDLKGALARPIQALDSVKLWLMEAAGVMRDTPARNWGALKAIWSNKAVFARAATSTLESFVEDALFAVVLPSFALDMLKTGATGNGLLMSSVFLGGFTASAIIRKIGPRLEERLGTYRFLSLLTVAACLAFIPSIGLWAAPSLWLAMPAVFLLKMLMQPLRSRMRALLQTQIKNDPALSARKDDIFSVMSLFEVFSAGAGALAFAWIFSHSALLAPLMGAFAPMKIVTAALVVIAGMYMVGLRWVKGQLGSSKQGSSK